MGGNFIFLTFRASLMLTLLFSAKPMPVVAQTTLPPAPFILDARFTPKPASAGTQLNYSMPFHMVRHPDGKRIVLGVSCPTFAFSCFNVVLARYDTAGQLDPAFGRNGITQFEDLALTHPDFIAIQRDFGSALFALELQHSGKAILGMQGGPSGPRLTLARFTQAGIPDASFGVSGIVTNSAIYWPTSLAVQVDDRIVVGSQGFSASSSDLQLTRLNADGTPDASFGSNSVVGIPALGVPRQILIQADGKIVVLTDFRITRFLPNGTPDPTFGLSGVSEGLCVFPCIALNSMRMLQVGEQFFVAGAQFSEESQAGIHYQGLAVWRINSDGRADLSFGSNGRRLMNVPGAGEEFTSFQVLPDRRMVIFGRPLGSDPIHPTTFTVARYGPTGELDASFGNGGIVNQDFGDPYSVLIATDLEPDGRLTLLGKAGLGNNDRTAFAIAQLNADGTLNPAYGQQGIAHTALVHPGDAVAQGRLLFQPDQKVIAVARTPYNADGPVYSSDTPEYYLIRYNPDGSLDATFGISGTVSLVIAGKSLQVNDAALQMDGAIMLAGMLSNTATLARYHPTGDLDTTFGINGLVTPPPEPLMESFAGVRIQPDGRLLAYTPYVNALLRFMPDGTPDTSFGSQGRFLTSTPIYDAQVMPDSRIIFASRNYSGTEALLTALDANGQIAPAFGTRGVYTYTLAPVENGSTRFCNPLSLTLQDSQVLMYGSTFFYPNVAGRGGYCTSGVLVRVTGQGQLDTTFGLSGTLQTPYRRDGHNIAANSQGIFLVEDLWTTGMDCLYICYRGTTHVWRYEPNGNPGSKVWVWGLKLPMNGVFGTSMYGLDGYINGIALDAQGRLMAAHTSVDSTLYAALLQANYRVNVTRLAQVNHVVPVPAVMR